ncbi:putative WRKY transcription factor 43 [Salvia divinorum]|uniref:WRKY transcription factor 43 n=1 Tax=Salvia divinorum TaxID=28513 RepID=A0ABD1G6Z8_SALDI
MEDHASRLFLNSSDPSPNMEGFHMGSKSIGFSASQTRSHVAEEPKTAAGRFLSEENNCDGMNISGGVGSANKMKKKKSEKKVRKPRFAFQTRSQVDILDDGYRWRKYGQKAVKNNKFPRSYYRCSREGCNVKKQVQRLSRDESVVVTTYEGNHTHPVDKPSDNFEQILSQMQIYPPL